MADRPRTPTIICHPCPPISPRRSRRSASNPAASKDTAGTKHSSHNFKYCCDSVRQTCTAPTVNVFNFFGFNLGAPGDYNVRMELSQPDPNTIGIGVATTTTKSRASSPSSPPPTQRRSASPSNSPPK
ncbi:unnamed protein product [Orchesella dallaii]|uniref:Uncharacterized protein n=1 Tax=Orchesella dallaii TaxID=48710 RepID=A0ABP1Q1I5_9HEXA